MNLLDIYCSDYPEWLLAFADTPQMKRLRDIGMNCGCEYTQFELFRNIERYSRYEHSLGVALIIWNFTHDMVQTLAGLFHDIATPVFAHTVDFKNGDYASQESTEAETGRVICQSREICLLLNRYGICPETVSDYHVYPIADNDTPRLSADRLEYTIGNAINYGFADRKFMQRLYDGVVKLVNEDGKPELGFEECMTAECFGRIALKCSGVYVSAADRYSMQILSELLAEAEQKEILTAKDFYTTETNVISLIKNDPYLRKQWEKFCSMSIMTETDKNASNERVRVVNAKKRYIDPLVAGMGRLSSISKAYRTEMFDFLNQTFSEELCGQ